MEATARYLQDPAHLLNTPLSAVLIDEAVARHYRPSEKMARARKHLVTLLTKVPYPTRNHPFANPQTVLDVRSVDPVFRC